MFRAHRLLSLLTLVPLALMAAPAQSPMLDGRPVLRATALVTATVVRPPAAVRSTTGARRLVQLDGVTVALRDDARQAVTVKHTTGFHARLSLWQRSSSGQWRLLARSRDGRTGYGGLIGRWDREQGTGATPVGTFKLLWAFGTHAVQPRWHLGYRTMRAGDYWVEDNASSYYNRYRNKAEGGFRWWLPPSDPNSSERLRSFPTQYEYAIVIGFNYAAQVRHRGAGIFLHVNGPGATAGCVSGPQWFLRRAMATLDSSQHPVIAIGR